MYILTAISVLSANTYSCGGEGSRFGRGGEASLGAALDLAGTFEKNLRIPSFLVNWRSFSSSEGAEESPEDSLSLMLVVVM